MPSTNSFYSSYLRIILRSLYFQAKILSIFCMNYDRTQNKLFRRKLYVDLIHSFIVYGTCLALLISIGSLSKNVWSQLSNYNYVLVVAEMFNGFTVIFAVAAIFVTNFIHREKISRLAGMMVFLDFTHFSNPNSKVLKRVFIKLFSKQVVTTLLILEHSLIFMFRLKEVGVLSFMFWMCGLLVGTILETVIILFYGTIVYLTKYYEILNERLTKVIREAENLVHLKPFAIITKSCELSDRLDELGHLYKKVFEAHDGLVDLYQLQILAIILSTYVNNVVMAFNAYSHFKNRNIDDGGNFHFYVMASCALLHYLDIILMIDVCHCNISTATNARNTVSKYELVGLDERLDRSVSCF